MLGRFCFSLLVLQSFCYLQVSAQNDPETSVEDEEIAEIGDPPLLNNFNEISVPLVTVEYEIARAGYIPSEREVALGNAELHCEGAREIADRIYWTKNGVRQDSAVFYDVEFEATVTSVYKLVDANEARYGCNGQYIYLVKGQPELEAQEASIWQNNKVICIDRVVREETKILEKMTTTRLGTFKSSIFYLVGRQQPVYPVKERKITADSVFMCNNTKHYTFISETRPQTTVEFKGKKVVCTNSDTQGRCALTIFFKDKKVAEGRSPVLEHPYGKINIQQVRCEAACQIGEDFITLPITDIEINRTLYIMVIFCIILIILIIIIIICCVLWHKFGFKEKYGYQINMRLKKNFAVDTNKLSSYRLSGVQADVPIEEVDGDDADVKEFRDMDDGSLDDSFVDPNFARTNNKIDMRSKDDISSSGASNNYNQKPFLRI